MLNINDKLDSLTEHQLKAVIKWTLSDLYNATHNYQGLNENVKGWCVMLDEAIKYQIDKQYKSTVNEEE